MNIEQDLTKGRALYLESAVYREDSKELILHFVTNPESPVKYAEVTFTGVEDFRDEPFAESPNEPTFESLVALEGGESLSSSSHHYVIETEERELTFVSKQNPKIRYY